MAQVKKSPDRRPLTRSENMSRIRGKDTKPELLVRKKLHGEGFRFRLHRRDLPGTPDIVLPKHKAVIFVHGCFWHAHKGCKNFKIPKNEAAFWRNKLMKNRERDVTSVSRLLSERWRVAVVWECALRLDQESSVHELIKWLVNDEQFTEITSERLSP